MTGSPMYDIQIEGKAFVNKIIPLGNGYVAVGRLRDVEDEVSDHGLIVAFDENGSILWQSVTEDSMGACEFKDAVRSDQGHIFALACNVESERPMFVAEYSDATLLRKVDLKIGDGYDGIKRGQSIEIYNDEIWTATAINYMGEATILFHRLSPLPHRN